LVGGSLFLQPKNLFQGHEAMTDEYDFDQFLLKVSNHNVTTAQLLPLAAQAIEAGIGKVHTAATILLIHKMITDSEINYSALQQQIMELNIEATTQRYLTSLARIAELFPAVGEERDQEVGRIVCCLIDRDSNDPILASPYCTDVNGESWAEVAAKWEQVMLGDPRDLKVLSNAGYFFLIRQPERAKVLFETCAQIDPENDEWNVRIAEAVKFLEPEDQ